MNRYDPILSEFCFVLAFHQDGKQQTGKLDTIPNLRQHLITMLFCLFVFVFFKTENDRYSSRCTYQLSIALQSPSFQQVRYYVKHCSLGDWLVLYQMARNMNKRFFAEFLYVLARFIIIAIFIIITITSILIVKLTSGK